MVDDRSDLEFEAVILVTRGDELPKKNYEKKRHPTYETSIRIKHTGKTKVTKPHLVIKFFNQYRDLYDALVKVGIGENLKINIDAPFPLSYKSSYLGVSLTEDQLQERCYLLNKWMQAVFQNYPFFPPEGQTIISQFLSLEDNDELGEANKELILSLLRRKQESRNNNSALVKSGSEQILTSMNTSPETAAPASPTVPLTTTGKPTSLTQSSGGGGVRFAADVPDNSEKPSLKLGEYSPSGKQISSKFSVYSEAPMLSGAEMEEYSQESFVNSFLAVSVLRGDMIPKGDGDSKLHHSYETIIRVLPFQDVILDANVIRDEVDVGFYTSKIATIPPISFMKVFDGYRQLMADLEAVGIFPKDHAHKAQAYDEDDNTRRRAIVVDAPFPKTFRRSSIGLGLTESQLQVRVVMLNNWMGHLLRAFNTFPGDAQRLILTFLGINASTNKLSTIPAFPEDGGDIAEYANATLYNILKGTFVLPKKKVEPPPPPPSATTTKSGNHASKKDKDDSSATKYSSEPQPLSTITWINGMNQHPSPAHLGPADGVTEYVVNTFLGVKVTQGEKMLRKAGDSKLHSAYEVRIRILTYGELSNPEKIDMDADAYQKLASLPPFTLARVFDAYRTLMRQLEEKRVYSKDRIEAVNSIGGSVVLDAVFPPTYGKSSLGIGLTEAEKLERATKLNQWMAALLMKYAHCTPEAQQIIHSFLGLEEDNPAEPANKYINAMLMKTYRPMQRPPPPQENGGKASKGNSKGKGGGKSNSSGVPGDGKVDAGCACIIS